ncbi:transcriptional repressor [Acinetobacter haemolyticus]|jgi:Fur family zinc uptake transcriptional regulator|uniref:Transcriptional repressor n=1 Tax=Acinetobacter sp. A1-4-2 TaxID=3156489 RepID=A0AAU7SX82_9GAMM|nr:MULTISPECIES: transcriptional repressor [unclassified Acinetobacter]OTG71108.1 Fur family transcriptional regulator [Acinetobacter sp. ANC 4218]QQN39570.1 transcriptional repressor [Acinetobacter sp. CS-2]UDM38103.1 transcriptional repressor [Acinetobacter haemolyticus]
MSLCSHEHHNALHGVHDHHNIATRLAEAESLCATTGARLTPLRKEVLELILNASGPMGAYDLLAKIKSESDRPAAPPTVYRTLDFLLEKGLIHRLTSINAYIPCCHPREGHQAAFLICTECKNVKEASAQGLLKQLDELSASDQFTAHHSIIEISGICQQCRNKQ